MGTTAGCRGEKGKVINFELNERGRRCAAQTHLCARLYAMSVAFTSGPLGKRVVMFVGRCRIAWGVEMVVGGGESWVNSSKKECEVGSSFLNPDARMGQKAAAVTRE